MVELAVSKDSGGDPACAPSGDFLYCRVMMGVSPVPQIMEDIVVAIQIATEQFFVPLPFVMEEIVVAIHSRGAVFLRATDHGENLGGLVVSPCRRSWRESDRAESSLREKRF